MMGKRKHHNPEQIVRKLQESDRLLNAGNSRLIPGRRCIQW